MFVLLHPFIVLYKVILTKILFVVASYFLLLFFFGFSYVFNFYLLCKTATYTYRVLDGEWLHSVFPWWHKHEHTRFWSRFHHHREQYYNTYLCLLSVILITGTGDYTLPQLAVPSADYELWWHTLFMPYCSSCIFSVYLNLFFFAFYFFCCHNVF